jgi:mRNA-degrading endonuclease HigB of HigAB toxin-antitoxin module
MYNKDTASASLKALLKAANGYFAAAKVFTGVAENRTGSLSLACRYGTNKLIQVNTNLPSDTPCVNFTAGDNGCNIDQSGNAYQWFGWAAMDNVDGTIVITFHFNAAFEAGQTYFLPAGAVFGFTDGSKYTLNQDYTFTFDGSSWTMTATEPTEPGEPEQPEPDENVLNFQYRYGAKNLIQINTDLPATTPCVNFLTTDNGCSIDQSGNKYQQIGWIGMEKVGSTIVLTLQFNNAFSPGQTYFLPAGSVFGFKDGSQYTLDKNYTFTFDGSAWSMTATEPEKEKTVSFFYRYGNNKLIQLNTDLPDTTPCANFLVTDNGSNIDQSGNLYQQVGWIGMEKVGSTIVLSFNFNSAFSPGQTYFLPIGSVFGFTDGSKYSLDKDYTFRFDGSSWQVNP